MMLKTNLVFLLGALALAGCKTQRPDPKDYILRPERSANVPEGAPAVALGRISIAPYLDKKGIVVETAPGELTTTRVHRWGEPLSYSVRRYLQAAIARAAGRSVGLNEAQLSGPGTLIAVSIEEFHASVDGKVHLVASYSLQPTAGDAPATADAAGKAPTASSQFLAEVEQESDGYPGLIAAHEILLDKLAAELATKL